MYQFPKHVAHVKIMMGNRVHARANVGDSSKIIVLMVIMKSGLSVAMTYLLGDFLFTCNTVHTLYVCTVKYTYFTQCTYNRIHK